MSIRIYRFLKMHQVQIVGHSNFFCWQDYVKSRNAAYGNNSAAIGSQKRVSDSIGCISSCVPEHIN